ncbi:MAG: Smr/MutS family protein [Saprospiraceae bacterium]|nr:Smr/MutS family protein [Saprospiraceae bacterium]
MILAIGTRVQISHTGDQGIVRAFLDNDMVEVHLPRENMNIPVAISDLTVPGGPKPDLPKKKTTEHRIPLPKQQFIALNPEGIQLAFEPLDGDTHYQVYLLNDTTHNVLYSFRRIQRGGSTISGHGKLDGGQALEIDKLLKTQLSDQTSYEIECWPILKMGSGKKRSGTIRLRPNVFFKSLRTVPILNIPMHWYSVIENFEEEKSTPKADDLKTYTAKNLKPKSHHRDEDWMETFDQHNVAEFAAFVPEIDLHIEALHPNPKSLNKNDILRYQLQQFDAFMEKAIRLGVDRVFIIHGIGKGKLRDAIFTRLLKNTDISTFKNEYHAKYGYGATEVIL